MSELKGESADVESTLSIWRLVATRQADPPDDFFPVNGFPSDPVRDAYLSRIDRWPEDEIRAILRNMLGESRNLAVWDELQLEIIRRTHTRASDPSVDLDRAFSAKIGDLAAVRPTFTEYERRLILTATKKSSLPTWEGLTWILDLLPHAPTDAVNAVSAYISANYAVLPDMRLNALFDALSVIRARYIGYSGATFAGQIELLLSLNSRDFEFLVSALYRRLGYDTVVTPPAKDYGKDVVASRSEPPEVLYVQCKNWRGRVPVEDAAGLICRVEVDRVTRGVLVGTSGFTQGQASATELAAGEARLELIDGTRLVQMLNTNLGRDWPNRVDWIIGSERRHQEKRPDA